LGRLALRARQEEEWVPALRERWEAGWSVASAGRAGPGEPLPGSELHPLTSAILPPISGKPLGIQGLAPRPAAPVSPGSSTSTAAALPFGASLLRSVALQPDRMPSLPELPSPLSTPGKRRAPAVEVPIPALDPPPFTDSPPANEAPARPQSVEEEWILPQAVAPRPEVYSPVAMRRRGNPLRRLLRSTLRLVDMVLSALLLPFRRPAVRWALLTVGAVLAVTAYQPARSALASVAAAAGRPLHERAAFSFQERFDQGPTDWMDPKAVTPADAGAVRVHGRTWNTRTVGLKDFEMTFAARIDRRAIGWAVRTAKPPGYYVFKLVDRGRAGGGRTARKLELVRHFVEDGQGGIRTERAVAPLEVYLADDAFLDVSVRVTEEQILTIVNGFGVDTCKLKQSTTGGVGLLAEDGEAFLVRSLTLAGNEDFLGLFLWGAQETFRSVWRNLSSLRA
jgi:hypothetical protein